MNAEVLAACMNERDQLADRCRVQREHVVALEAGLREACDLIDELTEDTPERAHAKRGRALRTLAGGR